METQMATSRYGFVQGGMTSSEQSSDSAFRAFSISMTTITLRDRVMALVLPT
jgi:hypothetical protein